MKRCSRFAPSLKVNREVTMLVCDYIVAKIDGDYAHLQRVDADEELKLVALALLPPQIREGSHLHYEWMEYTLMD